MSKINKDTISAIKAKVRRGNFSAALDIAKRAGIHPERYFDIVNSVAKKRGKNL